MVALHPFWGWHSLGAWCVSSLEIKVWTSLSASSGHSRGQDVANDLLHLRVGQTPLGEDVCKKSLYVAMTLRW